MNKIIEVVVSPQGETRLETKGFAGAGCQLASRFLEEALGVRQGEQLTHEFRHTAQQNQLREEA